MMRLCKGPCGRELPESMFTQKQSFCRRCRARRDLIRRNSEAWKAEQRLLDAEERPGVYKLTCVPLGLYYIGQTAALTLRCQKHYNDIISHTHGNPNVRELSYKYGIEEWNFEVVSIEPNKEMRRELEAELINANKEDCLNIYLNKAEKRTVQLTIF